MQTCLIQLKIGDKIIYEPKSRNMLLTIVNYKLSPNGINDPKLICLIKASRTDGFIVEATSDKFQIVDDEKYMSVYNDSLTK